MNCRKLSTSGNHGDGSSTAVRYQSKYLVDGRQTTPYKQNRSFSGNVPEGTVIPGVVSIETFLDSLATEWIGRVRISHGQDYGGRLNIRSIFKADRKSCLAAC